MSNLTKDEQEAVDFVTKIESDICCILVEHGPDHHVDGFDKITEYILDNFCPKTADGMNAVYVPAGSLIIPPEKVEALKDLVAMAEKIVRIEDEGNDVTRYVEFNNGENAINKCLPATLAELHLEEIPKR